MGRSGLFSLLSSASCLLACGPAAEQPTDSSGSRLTEDEGLGVSAAALREATLAVTSVTLAPSLLWGGMSSTGTVTLSAPAPSDGATISLLSGDPSTATVPAAIEIEAGATTGTFPIATTPDLTTKAATISASLNGVTVSATLTVSRLLPVGNAEYDPTLRAPRCVGPGSSCDSGRLLDGRAGLGPESHASNTIGDSCSDGPEGTYHIDSESLDRLTISTLDGTNLAPGKDVKIEASVFAFVYEWYPSDDRLDLYLTTDAAATPIAWQLLTPTSIVPPTGWTEAVLTYNFTLPAMGTSNLWAIRGNYRWSGDQAVCQPRWYDDYDDLIFAVDATGPFNRVPVVNAGLDQAVVLPASAALGGQATDDGLPNPPAALTTTWTKVSGPGTVSFADPTALATTATFSAPGSYTLRLTASDGAASSNDDVVIKVSGGDDPCAGICANPINFSISNRYQSGPLSTGARCYQTTSPIRGGKCGFFASPRTLQVNGTVEPCTGDAWSTIPAKVNGGYCIQISAGRYPYAYFSAW